MQNPNPPSYYVPFNSSKTYITFIIGDGDNVNFVKGEHFHWMQQRVKNCEQEPFYCHPLAWTISPAVLDLAPAWMKWYFDQSYATGKEWFILPPSGNTYAYPGEMSNSDQDSFIENTEKMRTL